MVKLGDIGILDDAEDEITKCVKEMRALGAKFSQIETDLANAAESIKEFRGHEEREDEMVSDWIKALMNRGAQLQVSINNYVVDIKAIRHKHL